MGVEVSDSRILPKKFGVVFALCVWAVVIGVSLSAAVIARSDDSDDSDRRGEQLLQRAGRSVTARRIARERYQFARWFASKTGDFPIGEMIGDYQETVLFPLGRADRMYVLRLPGYVNGEAVSEIYCFQRENGKNKRVYRVKLVSQDRLATKKRPLEKTSSFASILDYVTAEQSYFSGSVEHIEHDIVQGSRFAQTDLAVKRDYVEYDYEIPVDTLEVSLLSKRHTDGISVEETYDLRKDPLTKKNLAYYGHDGSTQGFYKKYGLPVTTKELESKKKP